MSELLGVPLPDGAFTELQQQAQRSVLDGRQPRPAQLAGRYIQEGLRMDAHPGVRFLNAPWGRAAALADGRLFVWELLDALAAHHGDLAATAATLGLPERTLQRALDYAVAYPDEVDGERRAALRR